MFGFFILVNLLLANQAVLGANPRVNGGFVDDTIVAGFGGSDSDSGSEVVLEFRPIPTAPSTDLRGQVIGILNTRGRRGQTRYRKVFDLLARSIDDRDALAKQEAKDRRRDSCCNCLATAVNTGIAIAGLGVAVWVATGNKEKQD